MAFIVPKIIGGIAFSSLVGDLGLTMMINALQLKQVPTQIIDSDILIEGYL